MKIYGVYFFIVFSTLFACGTNTNVQDLTAELDSLKQVNIGLVNQIDSLNNLLQNEKSEVFVFNKASGEKLSVGDSSELLIGLLYNRPSYCDSLFLSIFTNEDSLNYALANPKMQEFQYALPLQSDNGPILATHIKIPILSDEFNVAGGFISMPSSSGNKYIPFQYSYNY